MERNEDTEDYVEEEFEKKSDPEVKIKESENTFPAGITKLKKNLPRGSEWQNDPYYDEREDYLEIVDIKHDS